MKFKLILFIGIDMFIVSPLLAALSEPAAMKKARDTWGAVAMIGSDRDPFQSTWTRKVGYKSPGCVNEFTVVGKGPNIFDAAFSDADAHPATVRGPYRGMLTITAEAWDNVAVATITLIIDGIRLPQFIAPPNQPTLTASFPVATAGMADGFHVVCAQATDPAGNIGQSFAGYLFKTDQVTGTANDSWTLPHSGSRR